MRLWPIRAAGVNEIRTARLGRSGRSLLRQLLPGVSSGIPARASVRPQQSNARRRVIGFAFALAVVTYIDRICISAAAPFMMRDLGLSIVQMGVVFSSFTLAYSLFEIPSGWMGDVMGPRRVLTRIVLWWSAFTMLTGSVWSFSSAVVVRFLFGAGEAGAFPNVARSYSRWLPPPERGRAHGVLFLDRKSVV